MDIVGWIYKITNIQNKKVYIGQSIRPIQQRFRRHINDSLNNKLDTHFARAIRKYGEENFYIQQIDVAYTKQQLDEKQRNYIKAHNSVKCGYNETDATSKCGGNTYMSKTKEQMDVISQKIRATKVGALNPMSRRIKRTNIISGQVDFFNTIIACAKACGINHGKTSITCRLNGEIDAHFKGIWIFEYCDNESVSTIPDECKGVDSEIGTESKRKTI